MNQQTIDLYQYFGRKREKNARGYITAYLHTDITEMGQSSRRPAMLVLPGGGYEFVSQREAEPVAQEFFQQGYHAFVLDYSIAPEFHYPTCLIEAGMAMLYLRENAEKLGVLKDKIAAIGFSAGGHLAGLISLFYEDKALKEVFGGRCGQIRPDATVYSYPVVSADLKLAHSSSFDNLCSDIVKAADYSLENKVSKEASPAFIWATADDGVVRSANSLLLAQKYINAGVPCELHIFETGEHGLSTCSFDIMRSPEDVERVQRVSAWIPMCFAFLNDRGFKPVKIDR